MNAMQIGGGTRQQKPKLVLQSVKTGSRADDCIHAPFQRETDFRSKMLSDRAFPEQRIEQTVMVLLRACRR